MRDETDMKRNWDTLRKIMLALEEVEGESSCLESDSITGVDNETAFFHMRLLIEAGLAVGSCPEMLGRNHGSLTRLTWDGYELLDRVREKTVWNRIKEVARTKGLALSADVVKTIAGAVIKGIL